MIKAAVIGTGSMGRHHARVYEELQNTKLTSVSDINIERGSTIADKHSANFYEDYLELIAAEKPDLVSITVPTKDHKQVAIDCLNAGIHVLIEKPIASTVSEAEEIIQAAKTANKKMMIGHILRFNPAMRELKEHMDNGELGRIFQIISQREGPFPARIRDVGVIVDLATHDIDIMRFLAGSNFTRVSAEIEKQINTEHEDILLANMRLANGIMSSLQINWLTPTKIRKVTVLGEKGMFQVDDLTQDLYFYENSDAANGLWDSLKPIQGVNPGKMVRFAFKREEPLKLEINAFVNAVINDSDVPINGEDGLEALKVAIAIKHSGLTNQVVDIQNELE